MHTFTIGETDFGVNIAKTKIAILPTATGLFELSIDVVGDQRIFDDLSSVEDGEWAWALYPPAFFVHGLRLSREAADAAAPIRIKERRDDFELGLYMMEYSDVTDVSILLGAANQLTVQGRVDFWGKDLPFAIVVPHVG